MRHKQGRDGVPSIFVYGHKLCAVNVLQYSFSTHPFLFIFISLIPTMEVFFFNKKQYMRKLESLCARLIK
jgi:hypothetical protein